MQQAFFFLSLFLLDSQCTMLKHAHPLVPAMVEERTCPATKAEHTFFIVLFCLSSDTRQPFHMFWVIQFFLQSGLAGNKQSINC